MLIQYGSLTAKALWGHIWGHMGVSEWLMPPLTLITQAGRFLRHANQRGPKLGSS